MNLVDLVQRLLVPANFEKNITCTSAIFPEVPSTSFGTLRIKYNLVLEEHCSSLIVRLYIKIRVSV